MAGPHQSQGPGVLHLLHGGGHHTLRVAPPLLELDDDVDDDDQDDVDHVEQQPDVRQLQYGRLGEGADEGGEEGGEHQEAGDGAHEPVVEVLHVNEEGQVDEEPEDEGLNRRNVMLVRHRLSHCHNVTLWDLEEESDDDRVVDPVQLDVEPEGAASHGQVGLRPQLSHSERCQGFIS